MESATKTRTKAGSEERQLALKLGTLMLACFGGRGADEVVRVIDDSGLTFVQMKALISLQSPADTAPTVTGLAETLGISAASASRAVDGLVRKRLASRLEDSEDRRVRRLALTSKGQDLADRVIAARLAGLEDFAGTLTSAERRKLEGALDLLMQRPELAEVYETYERRAVSR
jgi:DNA-binding MarR family transcriptional regulator